MKMLQLQGTLVKELSLHVQKEKIKHAATYAKELLVANMNNNELHQKVESMTEEAETLRKDILLSTDEVNDVQEEFDEIQ